MEWRAQAVKGGFAPPMQEVACVVVVEVWWNVIVSFGVVLYYWHCSGGLPVVGQNFLEIIEVLLWVCSGPSQPSFRSIEYIKCTLPATPLQRT